MPEEFVFTKIQRKWFPLRIVITAEPGGGKTLSAMKMAVGIANYNYDKVFLIDTDNERSAFYADLYAPNHINYLSLPPPHSPQRFGEAIAAAEKAGAEVIIVDTASDCWEGVGGAASIAEADKGSWLRAKNQWNLKFMVRANQSHCHIIFTVVAKPVGTPEKEREKQIERAPAKFANKDYGLVIEKSFMRPQTLGIFTSDYGKKSMVFKAFHGLAPTAEKIVAPITEQHGQLLRQWVEDLAKPDVEVEVAKTSLRTASLEGMAKLQAARKEIPVEVLKRIGNYTLNEIKSAAEEIDRQREEAKKDETGENAAV